MTSPDVFAALVPEGGRRPLLASGRDYGGVRWRRRGTVVELAVPLRAPIGAGYERELGRHALCFTCRDGQGYVLMELVVVRDGGAFDLLGSW